MDNAGSFDAAVAQLCGIGFPCSYFIHFLPMLKQSLLDQTLFLILKKAKGACSANY